MLIELVVGKVEEMDPYTGREIIKICSKCFIHLKNDTDLEYHEYIVHGREPAKKPETSQDLEDRLLSKSEITAIRRCVTRGEKGISSVYKHTLVNLVCKDENASETSQVQAEVDNQDENESAEEADSENSSEDSMDESSEEIDEPIKKQALLFLREMMKAAASNQIELKCSMFVDIIDSLV